MNVTHRFRGYFLRGLAVLLPTILTIWILAWGYGLIQRNISVHINKGIVKAQTWVWVQKHEGISTARSRNTRRTSTRDSSMVLPAHLWAF